MADTQAADLEQQGARPSRRRPLLLLWAVLAVLAVGIGAVVVAGDDDGPPKLPVALGGDGEARSEAGTAAAGDAATSMMAWVRYLAADDLPALGGEARAHRVPDAVDPQRLRELADAFGLDGEPVEQPGTEGTWQLEASDGSLLGAGPFGGGSWWYTSAAVLDAGREEQLAASGGGAGSVASPDAEPRPGPEPAPPPAPEPFVPPADLPSEAEAEAIALDLFGRLGADLEGARVATQGPFDAWYVSIEPLVDGLVVSGYVLHAAVGPHGEVTNAGGVLNRPEALGDYPTVDTADAIARLNEQTGGGFGESRGAGTEHDAASATVDCPAATAGDATEPASDLPVDPVCEPGSPSGPTEIVLREVERILMLVPSFDEGGVSFLVPGYRFFHDGGAGFADVIAVDDASLVPPPAVIEPLPVEPEPGDTPATVDGAGSAPVGER